MGKQTNKQKININFLTSKKNDKRMFCPSRHALVQPGISSSYSVLMQHLKYLVEILFVCEIFSSHHEAIAMVRNLWWSCRGRKVKKLLLIMAADPPRSTGEQLESRDHTL